MRLMQHARAFVFAAEEDFGIAMVEAQACGTPVIAFGGAARATSLYCRSVPIRPVCYSVNKRRTQWRSQLRNSTDWMALSPARHAATTPCDFRSLGSVPKYEDSWLAPWGSASSRPPQFTLCLP